MDIREKIQGFSVKDKSVCIVGCGGLGTNVAVHLAGTGTGKIYLCDFDKINRSNLNRQFFYTEKDIDRIKCEVLKEKLALYSTDTEFIAVNKKIKNTDDLSFAKECDIIICAADNSECRLILSDFAEKENIPVVYGAIESFYGTSYLYIPKKSPCTECAGIISKTKARLSVSSTAGIVGSMQAGLTLKYLTDKDITLSGKIYLYDGDLWETLSVKANKNCKKCNLSEVIK